MTESPSSEDTQAEGTGARRQVLWWGRSGLDYSRNRILRQCLHRLGWHIRDFWPRSSRLAGLEAAWKLREVPDLVWVPCFRQRDVGPAARWAAKHGIPVVFDPMISSFDKQVYEREKIPAGGWRARRLLNWERQRFARVDRVLADTAAHADYFHQQLGVPREKLAVVPLGAEDKHFLPCPQHPPRQAVEVLFYGSFIPLQGPEVVIEAARAYTGPPVQWTLLGNGPLLNRCKGLAGDLSTIRFEEWLPYDDLPARICQADLLLGVFGTAEKSARVIPNKVYQALACAKPVITRQADAYPQALTSARDSGLFWVPPGDAGALAAQVEKLVRDPDMLASSCNQARDTFAQYFSITRVGMELQAALAPLFPDPNR